jgi:hypothetical protein
MFKGKILALGAVAATAAIGSSAFALNQAAVDAVAGTTANEFYISGSSAADAVVKSFIFGTICNAGTTDIYQDIDATGVKGGLWTVYSCTLSNNAFVPAAIQGQDALFYKRSKIGSVFGALPIINNGYVEFLNVRSNRGSGACVADTAANTFNCTVAAPGPLRDLPRHAAVADECDYQSTAPANGASGAAIIPIAAGLDTVCRRPSLGIADTETELFVGDNLPKAPNNFTAATAAQMNAAYGAVASTATRYRTVGQMFGIAVSNSVWNGLQAAQGIAAGAPLADGSNWPSLTKQQIRGILTGNLTTWSSVTQGLALGALDTIAVCRRENGSGTQAGTNQFFLDYPCSTFEHAAVDTGSVPAGTFFVQENTTSNYVKACLNEAESGGANANPGVTMGAIGLLGYSGDPSSPVAADAVNYRWVKIDGIQPSMQNAVTGKYEDWFEMQTSYNHLVGNEKTLMANMISEMRSPARITTAAAKGIAALQIVGGAGLNSWDNAVNNTAFSQYTGTNPVMGGYHGNVAAYANGALPPVSCRAIIPAADTANLPNR